jgi:glucose inhibited division protein A
MKIVVIGGGWAGIAAAVAAKKLGADVCLIEKTDMLLGCGNVGGIMRNNGRYTATEEMISLGAGELFEIIDRIALHRDIKFPGHEHALLYPVNTIEAHIRRFVRSLGIELKFENRVIDVAFDDGTIRELVLHSGEKISGNVFVETTGSSGPMGNCIQYGHGCSMCVLRCPAFGPRISISEKCGVNDYNGEREGSIFGVFSGSCKLDKESLSREIRDELSNNGVVVLKVPPEDIDYDKLHAKACKQYALKEFSENIILLDTGHAKLMTSYYPIDKLRKISGLENAKYVDPYAGSSRNSIRFFSIAPRGNEMRVDSVKNLFCGGEKSGLFVGHTEAICTGTLAGYNAARMAYGLPLIVLPDTLAVGALIAYANHQYKEQYNTVERFTFAGGVFFERMNTQGLYSIQHKEIAQRVENEKLSGIFNQTISD